MPIRRSDCGCYRNENGFVPCSKHDAALKEIEKVATDVGLLLKLQTVTILVAGRP